MNELSRAGFFFGLPASTPGQPANRVEPSGAALDARKLKYMKILPLPRAGVADGNVNVVDSIPSFRTGNRIPSWFHDRGAGMQHRTLSFSVLILACFMTTAFAQAKEAGQGTISLEAGGGLNACAGDSCKEGGPSGGLDFTGMVGINPHFGIGFNVHYGLLSPDKLDTMYYHILNFEARGILPVGSRVKLFGSLNFGYVTTYMDGVFEDNDNKYMVFRATGVTAGATAGLAVRITERFSLGVLGRLWVPNWTEACAYEELGGQCMEPSDLDVKLDMNPWYAGMFVQYELPR